MTDEKTSHILIPLNPKWLLYLLSFVLGAAGFGGLSLVSPSSGYVVDVGERMIKQMASMDSTVRVIQRDYARARLMQESAVYRNRIKIDSLEKRVTSGFGALDWKSDQILRRLGELESQVSSN